jgi:hypothetical protein
MVPAAVGTHFDDKPLARGFASIEAGHLFVAGDTTTVLRQPRAKHIGDFDKCLVFTDGAGVPDINTTELSVALELSLRVAYLLGRQVALSPCLQSRLSGQAIVNARAAAKSGFGKSHLHEA